MVAWRRRTGHQTPVVMAKKYIHTTRVTTALLLPHLDPATPPVPPCHYHNLWWCVYDRHYYYLLFLLRRGAARFLFCCLPAWLPFTYHHTHPFSHATHPTPRLQLTHAGGLFPRVWFPGSTLAFCPARAGDSGVALPPFNAHGCCVRAPPCVNSHRWRVNWAGWRGAPWRRPMCYFPM